MAALDDEADARTPSPAARAASRAQGRALVRVAPAAWPSPLWAALLAAYLAATAPATAAQRLLGLDPVTVTAVLAALGPEQERVTDAAASAAARGEPPAADADPLTDLAATHHARRLDRLFAS